MRILNKCKGAISVFLIIVLVPTITCAGLFVDASRAKSATALVSSAGDLTLNTILSQYDVDLSDFYGLMASAQNTDDILNAAEQYFKECIISADYNPSDASRYASAVSGTVFGDTDINDLLGIKLQDGQKVKAEKVKNGSLTNPALVKTQIVEFMKYRAPINGVVDLLDKFKKSSKDLENSSKNSTIVDEKQDYYEAQGEVAKKAYEIYKQIEEYNKLGVTKNFINETKQLTDTLESKYRDLHKKMVKDLYNTQGMSSDDFNYMIKISSVSSSYTSSPKYSSDKHPDLNTIKKQLEATIGYYSNYITNRNSFNNKYQTKTANDYGLQYYAHIKADKTAFGNYYSAQRTVVFNYLKLKNMLENAEDDVLSTVYTTKYYKNYPQTTDTVGNLCNNIMRNIKSDTDNSASGSSKYTQIVSSLKGIYNSDYGMTNISETANTIADLYNQLNSRNEIIKKAEDLLKKISKGLKDLKSKVVEADKKFNQWDRDATSYKNDISLAKDDCKEISDIKKYDKKLKTSDIDSYKNRIDNVHSAMTSLKKGIESAKYNDCSIVKKPINTYDSFKKHSNVVSSQIPVNKFDLDEYAKNTFKFSINKENLNINITSNNNPNIKDSPVYKWMLDQGFPSLDDSEVKKGEDDRDAEKEKANNRAEGDDSTGPNCSSNDISTLGIDWLNAGASGDSGKVKNDIGKVTSFVSSLFGNFGSTVKQAGVDSRDALYTLEYITDMFTYDTFEYEAKFSHLDESKQNSINRNNYSSYYSACDSWWKNKDVTFTENKTLTNKLRISSATNWSYGNEVEYIMYGKSNKDSKSSLSTAIFMIRFAMNIPIIFKSFWNNDAALQTLATTIEGATCGIVPAPLTKLIVCIGLVCLESAMDLKTLKKGIPVILLKTKENDLFVRPNTGYIPQENPTSKVTEKIAFQYSDYMKMILFIKLMGSESNNIYKRTAAVIQTNMGKCVLKQDGYTFSKSQVYFKVSAKLEVPPLMLDTSLIQSFIHRDVEDGKWNKISYSAIRGY